MVAGEHSVRRVSKFRKLQPHLVGSRRLSCGLHAAMFAIPSCSDSSSLLAEPQPPFAGYWNVRSFGPHAGARVQSQIACCVLLSKHLN
jgi:hypothetical protein